MLRGLGLQAVSRFGIDGLVAAQSPIFEGGAGVLKVLLPALSTEHDVEEAHRQVLTGNSPTRCSTVLGVARILNHF